MVARDKTLLFVWLLLLPYNGGARGKGGNAGVVVVTSLQVPTTTPTSSSSFGRRSRGRKEERIGTTTVTTTTTTSTSTITCLAMAASETKTTTTTTTTTSTTTTTTVPRELQQQQLGWFEDLSSEIRHAQEQRRVVARSYLPTVDDSEDSAHGSDFHVLWQHQQDLQQVHLRRLEAAWVAAKAASKQQAAGTMATTIIEADNPTTAAATSTTQTPGDTILFVEHEPVYTLGTSANATTDILVPWRNANGDHASDENEPDDDHNESDDITHVLNVVPIHRGGQVTYHGPGQLTVYPVLDLRHYRCDLHWYLRALEEVVVRACHRIGLTEATRDAETTGVWMGPYKIAAVGVQVRRWITQHGVAVNVRHTVVEGFEKIVPCGLVGRPVGSLEQFLREQGREPVTVAEFAEVMQAAMEEVFAIRMEWEEMES